MAITSKLAVNRRATGQTTDATPLVLLTYTVPSGAVGIARVRIIGQKAATTVHYVIERRGLIKESAGTAAWIVLTGAAPADAVEYDVHASATGWVTAVAASTNTITVTVTGQAATTIDWLVVLEYDLITNP